MMIEIEEGMNINIKIMKLDKEKKKIEDIMMISRKIIIILEKVIELF